MKISQLRLQMIIREELQLHSSASRLLREDTADMMEWAALATDLAALGMLATGVGAPAAAALSAASSALDVGAATAHFEKNNNVEGVFNLLGAALPAFPVAPAWKVFKYIKGAKVNLFKQAPAAFVKVLEMLVDQLMSFTSGLVDYLGGDDINDSLAEFRDKIKEGISDLTRDLKQIKAKMNQGNKPLKMKFPTEDAIKKAIEDHAEELEALAPLMRRAHLLHPSKLALLVKRLEQLGLELGGLNETVRISRGQLRRIIREELCDHRRSQ